MYKLICLSGQSSARSFILKEGDNTIGRLEQSDIKINSNGVSKQHAIIVVKGGNITVSDVGSKNGTFVNGVMVKKKELGVGDKIAIHDHVYQLVKGDISASDLPSVSSFDRAVADDDLEYKGNPRVKAPGIKGDINNFLDTTVMPFFESIMNRYYVSALITSLTVFIVAAIVLIVTIPIVEFDSYVLDRETSQRAAYLATLLAEQNKNTIGAENPEPPSIKAV